MPNLTEPIRLSDLLKFEEAEIQYSRDQVTLASGNDLPRGAVLGVITASGKYAEFDPAATNGTQAAKAVLLYPSDASAADLQVTALKRYAVVAKQHLAWKTGTTAGEILAALAQLEAVGIIARDAA